MMRLDCHEVWLEISNYIDDAVTPAMRAELEAHLAQCRNCAALLDSVHNVVVLIADDRRFELPVGFSERLHLRLALELAGDGS